MSFSLSTDNSFVLDNEIDQELDIELDNNTKTVNTSKKRRSDVWIHYTWDNIKSKAKCNHCGQVYYFNF
jgi:hypothetical protein